MICEDGKVGLVDFGNVQRVPDLAQRRAIARLYLALAKDYTEREETWNDVEIAAAFQATGAKTKRRNVKFLAVNAITGYDMRVDAATMRRFGLKPDWSDAVQVFNEMDVWEEWPADLINLQRLSQTLVGLAGLIGAGQPSCARMWRPYCERLLQCAES